MATVASILYKIGRSTNLESEEFMLVWAGRQGEPYQWLFTDWNENTATETTPINRANESNVRTMPSDETTVIELTAEDISANELAAFKSLAVTTFAAKMTKAGALTRVSVLGTSYSRRANAPRYDYKAIIQMPRIPLFE